MITCEINVLCFKVRAKLVQNHPETQTYNKFKLLVMETDKYLLRIMILM